MQFFLKKNKKKLRWKRKSNLFFLFFANTHSSISSTKKIKNLILKEHFHPSESDLQTANLHHKRKSDFFSASYSGDRLLLRISKEKIGVDLEIIKPRDKSLLNEYKAELEVYF